MTGKRTANPFVLQTALLLSLPLMLAGIAFLWAAHRAKPAQATG